MSAYYNEFDKGAAAWLRELIKRGLIASGDVDERSIVDVRPDDLAGYRQCHFFAGIGGWSYALRLAGWPDDRPVWTGSCPCQPFSAAGKREGFADDRHLWPVWFGLISKRQPATVFGEQVASKDGLDWLDTVSADMEGAGYAIGAADLCAAGVGAPHIRQRLYWVADNNNNGFGRIASPRLHERREAAGGEESSARQADGSRWNDALRRGKSGRLGHNNNPRLEGLAGNGNHVGRQGRVDALASGSTPETGEFGGMADANNERRERSSGDGRQAQRGVEHPIGNHRPGPVNGYWRDSDWLFCRDGKWRPVEPGTQQMVDGISRGMGLLRADHIAKEEMNHATEAVGLADQVLRALRSGHGAQAVWGSLGGCVGLPEATLLLASLCQQSRELGWFFDRATAGGAPGGEGIVRAVRQGAPEAACASPGRGCTEQLAWELGDALPELSQACPSARQHLDQLRQFTGSPLAHGIPARVGRLRGYGNAIVPQVAAEFIGAFLDVTEQT